jgi:carbon monoxide dehydrogenase subunit G
VQIDAPTDQVWAALADFGNVANYSPGVVSSHSTSEESTGLGATRHCSLALFGASVEERIVGWNEEELLAIDIYETSRFPVVKNAGATFTLETVGEGTILEGVIDYDLKYGPLGSVMHSMSIQKQSDRSWRLFLAGIKQHVETGQTIDKDTRVPVEAVAGVRWA